MPMPRWWTHINKRVFNPRELRRGERPVLTHVGRSSGTVYRTPLDAHPVDGGYVFILVYGSRSDWVRNALAAGGARLRYAGQDIDLTAPRLIDADEAWSAIGDAAKRPPGSGLAPGRTKPREYSRSGLGLSIVKELCKLLGGSIYLESRLGKGSTFTVLLPLVLPDQHYRLDPSAAPMIDLAKARLVHFGRRPTVPARGGDGSTATGP